MQDVMQDVMLDVNNLNAFYGRAHILFDVNLNVRRGEVVALVGRNGAGKSTTMKAIMGMLSRTQGKVSFLGSNISTCSAHFIAKMGMGFVPEDRRVFTDLSVLENLTVGVQAKREGAPYWSAEKLFELFPNLGEMPHRPGGQMSGGEQQMLSVSRTLMGNPYMVLLDEPSEGVAPVIVEQMANMIMALKKQGLTILLSEQNLQFANLVCDRAYVLENGHIRFAGDMQELAGNEEVRRNYLTV